ncbi:MAG: hypothetical protein M1826_005944 [Phylliscum demangeonii]|nr:MAG: hypothetical protein M1826_005944 [Phylliscum demangeonii]
MKIPPALVLAAGTLAAVSSRVALGAPIAAEEHRNADGNQRSAVPMIGLLGASSIGASLIGHHIGSKQLEAQKAVTAGTQAKLDAARDELAAKHEELAAKNVQLSDRLRQLRQLQDELVVTQAKLGKTPSAKLTKALEAKLQKTMTYDERLENVRQCWTEELQRLMERLPADGWPDGISQDAWDECIIRAGTDPYSTDYHRLRAIRTTADEDVKAIARKYQRSNGLFQDAAPAIATEPLTPPLPATMPFTPAPALKRLTAWGGAELHRWAKSAAAGEYRWQLALGRAAAAAHAAHPAPRAPAFVHAPRGAPALAALEEGL